MFHSVNVMPLSWVNTSRSSLSPLACVLDGSVAGLNHILQSRDEIEGIVEIVFERVILEGFKAPIREERLKEMVGLLVTDPRFTHQMLIDFFTTFKFEQTYCSYKAVTFWQYLKQVCPNKLDNPSFFQFLLRSTSRKGDDAELLVVDECVKDLLKHVDLEQVKDVSLCVHHRFFSIIYAQWAISSKKLIAECSKRESSFSIPNLVYILKANKEKLPSNYFDLTVINHCFRVSIFLLNNKFLLERKIKRELFVRPLLSTEDEKNESRIKLMKKIRRAEHLPQAVKDYYNTALQKCGSAFLDQMDVSTSASSEEPTTKKARKE